MMSLKLPLCPHLTTIEDRFLYDCEALMTADLSGFTGVTSIKKHCLLLSYNLRSVIAIKDSVIAEKITELNRAGVTLVLVDSGT